MIVARRFCNLGCSRLEFIAHLESLWQPGMTWDTYGKLGWQVDHIIPKRDGLIEHYTNLRPRWHKENNADAGTGQYTLGAGERWRYSKRPGK